MPMPNFHSARIKDPGLFLEKPWATIDIKPGITLVTGKYKTDGPGGSMVGQSYRFDKDKFTVDQAKKWLKKHKVKTILFEPAKPEEKKEMSQIARDVLNELCKTPGLKIRSKGRGLARGKGKGPIGVPFGEVSTMANVAPNVKPWSFVIPKKKKKKKVGIAEQGIEAAKASNLTNNKATGSYEQLKDLIQAELKKDGKFGKFPFIQWTFKDYVFVEADFGGSPLPTKFFKVPYKMEKGVVTLGVPTEVEKVTKFVVKEMAEGLMNQLFEAKWTVASINDLPDSAFAYIEPGGKKDEQGKTVPRSLRHFPLKGKDGNYDQAHVINALQRLDQTTLGDDVKAKIKIAIKKGYKALDMEWPKEKKEGVVSDIATAVLESLFAEGGGGSGNWGHKGRPGHLGGSLGGGGKGKGAGGAAVAAVGGGAGGAGKLSAGKFFGAGGALKVSDYKKLGGSQKAAVLQHGVTQYKERYVPKAKQAGMSAAALSANKKVGALEGMRRAALNKSKGLFGKEQRAGLHIAISLQQRASQVAGAMKASTSRVAVASLVAAKVAERQPGR